MYYFKHVTQLITYLKRPWWWERFKPGEGDVRAWDGWMALLTQWTWVWASSRSWWWIGRPGVLQYMGVTKSWTGQSDWTELYNKNLCFRIQWTCGEHFMPPAGCERIFPTKSCQDAWRSKYLLVSERSVEYGRWRKTLYLNSFNFEASVVWYAVGCCHGEELGPFCWPIVGAVTVAFVHLINLLSTPLKYKVSLGFRKLQWIRWAVGHQTVTLTFFWCKIGFGKCFGVCLWSSHWAAHHHFQRNG